MKNFEINKSRKSKQIYTPTNLEPLVNGKNFDIVMM